jgi:Ran GTPase-activating protein (RanGAP) involved in mRNA processing and transport
VNIAENGIGGVEGEPFVKGLAQMLAATHCLVDLDISKNKLDAECTQLVADALRSNTSLQRLGFTGNNPSSDGVKHLVVAFKTNRTITALDVSASGLTRHQVNGLQQACAGSVINFSS